MKKLLISTLLSLLSLLFIFVSCTSQGGGLPQGTTAGEVPAGSEIAPDETTSENEVPPSETTDADSSTMITTTEPYETVDPDLLYEIRNSPFADEAWLKRALPNIMDISVEYRIPEKEFEPVYCDSSEDRKTLEELIKIVGKPHGFTNRTGILWLVWITQEGTFVRAGIDQMTSNVPEGISLEERIFRYSLIYVQRLQAAPESTSEEVTTLPEYFEAFSEEQKEQLLQIMQKHPDVVAFSNQYPSVFDADFSNCVSSDVFYALLEELNGASIKFEDLIEIVGKPHYRTVLSTGNVSLISTTSVFTWVSSDGKLFSATIQNRLEYPEEASLEEILLYYCEIVLHGSEASTNTQSLNTTASPETTAVP